MDDPDYVPFVPFLQEDGNPFNIQFTGDTDTDTDDDEDYLSKLTAEGLTFAQRKDKAEEYANELIRDGGTPNAKNLDLLSAIETVKRNYR